MRLANPKPPYCSACFQHSTGEHVDFEVFWDGPVIDSEGHKYTIDDLFLCESCVKTAARLLGWQEPSGESEERAAMEEEIQSLKREISAKNALLGNYQHTLDTVVEFPFKRKGGHPEIVGLDKQKKKELLHKKRISDSNKRTQAKKRAPAAHR